MVVVGDVELDDVFWFGFFKYFNILLVVVFFEDGFFLVDYFFEFVGIRIDEVFYFIVGEGYFGYVFGVNVFENVFWDYECILFLVEEYLKLLELVVRGFVEDELNCFVINDFYFFEVKVVLVFKVDFFIVFIGEFDVFSS